MRIYRNGYRAAVSFLWAAFVACQDSTAPHHQTFADMTVTTTTTGDALDPDGYALSASGVVSARWRVGPNDTITRRLSAGRYTITLSDVNPNCSLSDPGPFALTLAQGQTPALRIAVTCLSQTPPTQTGAILVGVSSQSYL